MNIFGSHLKRTGWHRLNMSFKNRLSAPEKDILEEYKTFKAGKKPEASSQFEDSSQQASHSLNHTQPFICTEDCSIFTSRFELVSWESRIGTLLFPRQMIYVLTEMSEATDNCNSAFLQPYFIPPLTGTQRSRISCAEEGSNAVLCDAYMPQIGGKSLARAKILHDDTAKGQHRATVRAGSLQTCKIYFRVAYVLRLLHDSG